jgi:glutaredoxin
MNEALVRHARPLALPLSLSLALPVALALLAGSAQAQQVYRIVGPDGKVTFSDQPPPASAPAQKVTSVGTARGGDAALDASTANLPATLKTVVNKYPVTLYTTASCAPCDQGRALLTQRGVPFAEKTIATNDDKQAFEKLGSNATVPLLMLGGQKVNGFETVEWNNYLDAAGYPKASTLPSSYRNPPAQPLAPPAAVDPNAPAPTAGATPSARPPRPARPAPQRNPAEDNPAGIKF